MTWTVTEITAAERIGSVFEGTRVVNAWVTATTFGDEQVRFRAPPEDFRVGEKVEVIIKKHEDA